ncbi:MAG: 1,4-dihydroxy-2-naphthoate octaprenyltransferase [Acidimicrobiales bacterium]|nr:MAG: 1,4-dihydroxy-2-naphthoate octaprenyltransferase [Acidimicrobiales bacterium]
MNAPPTGARLWLAGARLRTLPAAIVPVAVGTAVAVGQESDTAWWRSPVALLVALALQVGVNYANDYSDGVRGTDGEARVGPLRLVGSGLVPAATVKRAATLAFALAGAAGTALAVAVGPELFVVGVLCLLAGWTYTGGPRPYGYLGLGEVFVFVFFGLVATVGTTYVLLERVDATAVWCSVTVGLWAVALMLTNNLRDIPGDTEAGKQTIAVRLGDARTRVVYLGTHVVALAVAVAATPIAGRVALGALAALPFAGLAIAAVRGGARGPDLIPVLGMTARAQMLGGLGLTLSLALTA